MCRFIVTATPEFVQAALAELQAAAPDLRVACRFKDGIFMVETGATGMPAALAVLKPVFVRHLMPVGAEVTVAGRREADLYAILEAARRVSTELTGRAFMVQCRCVGEHGYRARDVEVFVGEAIEAAGGIPVLPEDEVPADAAPQVISIYVYGDTAFLGCSSAAENLAPHCDECRLCSDQPRVICRAELKLQEALRRFRLQVGTGRALDLGAAPGGWTWLLAGLGMEVVAVDPADLDPRVSALPGVVHVRGRAEAFESGCMFDLLVNDVYLAPLESAGVMVRSARYLKPGAPALMTAKLANRRSVAALAAVRAALEPAYEELGARNLFHNRREITLLLRRRAAETVPGVCPGSRD